ncbi:MAG: helix-turn-helix transcriptional regulator [Clostridia bacterium]|nr:helix-turn-helix transcriptional regulator [Clostridia bacterium]
MYVSYSKLWKLLIDKDITKTELLEITGISSRTMSKLSKNQTVTTDTLLTICKALDCDISDIMEICTEEENLSLYQAFKRDKRLICKNELCTTYQLTYKSKEYTIKITNKIANKHTCIHCRVDGIMWEQFYPVGIQPASEIANLSKKSFANENTRGVFVIKGSPLLLKGQGDNGYLHPKQAPTKKDDIYVVTLAELKLVDAKKEWN